MTVKKAKLVLKAPYKKGWILVANDTLKIEAFAKSFTDIVVKSESFDPSKYSIFSAADSWRYQLWNIHI